MFPCSVQPTQPQIPDDSGVQQTACLLCAAGRRAGRQRGDWRGISAKRIIGGSFWVEADVQHPLLYPAVSEMCCSGFQFFFSSIIFVLLFFCVCGCGG